jgi:hypothetical protein
LKELRGFLGLSGYYRKFIRYYAILCQPLTALLKKGVLFVWIDARETAFQVLKNALSTAPVLALPNFSLPFIVETDACDVGTHVVLSQQGHPLAFVSRALGPKNRSLSVYEKEYLAILLAVQQWRPYLQITEFIIRTDHKSLVHLTDQRLHTEWQQRALTKLMGLQYSVQYKKGAPNGATDALSRKPVDTSPVMVATTLKPVWLDQVAASYASDVQIQQLIQRLAIDGSADPSYSLTGGLLRWHGRLWIGPDKDLQCTIIQAFHDSPVGGHSGFPITYRRLLSLFKWSDMKLAVKQYVTSARKQNLSVPCRLASCSPCPFPLLPGRWRPWISSMDCPNLASSNCILVVVDKLTKYAHFVPLRHPYTATKVAEAFINNVYKLHGLPQSLVSDPDPVFTSQF